MSNNDEASGSNDPLPNDENENDDEINYGNLPDRALHLIFREALDRQNIVPELANINQEIRFLRNQRQRLINERTNYQRMLDDIEPKSVMDLQQAIRKQDNTWFDINAHQQLYRGGERFRDEHQRQIDALEEHIQQRSGIQTALLGQFLFYMSLMKRHRY